MSVRKLTLAFGVAALGLVLAGGVLIGSNMGFKLERNFRYFQGNQNLYDLSIPFFSEYATSDELLTDFIGNPTTNQFNNMTLVRIDNTLNEYQTRLIDTNPLWVDQQCGPGEVGIQCPWLISGDDTWTVDQSAGYTLQVRSNTGPTGDDNNVVIVGSHDPEFAGLPLSYTGGALNLYQLSVPYHTTWENIQDLLIDTFVNWAQPSIANNDVAKATAFSFLNFDLQNPTVSVNEYYTVLVDDNPLWMGDQCARGEVGIHCPWLISGDTNPADNGTFNITPGSGYILQTRGDAANPFGVTYLSPHF